MKRPVRRLLGICLVLALLACSAYGLTTEDSLISLNYLTQWFMPEAVRTGETAAQETLRDIYDEAKESLDAVQKDLMVQAIGSEEGLYSAVLSDREWSDGDMLELSTGAGFKMGEGTAVVTHNGIVVDVTDGKEIPAGTRLVKNHRYLVGEDTTAQVFVLSGAARLGVQGHYAATEGRDDPTPFYDVAQTDSYYEAVQHVYQNGLFSGTGEHEFSPDIVMNRAMVMTVFYQLAGAPSQQMAAADVQFTDVPDTAWFAPYVKWAAAQQITAGTGPDTFTPEQKINREQMVVLLYSFATRYLGLTLDHRTDLSAFTDLDTVNTWALDAMSWAVADGILSSATPDAMVLAPRADADRAAVATMLQAFAEKIQ